MKKIIVSVFISLMPLFAMAQAKIQTKQYIISDLPEKSMKVVLSGNEMVDATLREHMNELWRLGPFEFCDQAEFEQIKKSPDYYFLAIPDVRQMDEAEAGIRSIILYKGKETATEGFSGMYKVCSIPYAAADGSDGKEMEFFPILLDIFQKEIQKMMKRPVNFSTTVPAEIRTGKWKSTIYIAEDDLAFEAGNSLKAVYAHENIHVVEPDVALHAASQHGKGTFVCYVVAPFFPKEGAVSYTMLIDVSENKLVYIQSHRITEKDPRGVLQKEIKSFISKN